MVNELGVLFKKNPVFLLSLLQSAAGLHFIYQYKKQNKEFKKLHRIATYLVDIIEKNDIYLTEYDAIVLGELGMRLTVVEES